MNRIYIGFCCLVALFVIIARPIYSNNYSFLQSFQPINVSIFAKDCTKYTLLPLQNGIARLYSNDIDSVAFYPYSFNNGVGVCNMARNVIELGVNNLIIKVDSKEALDDIEFISLTIGNRNFYINKDEIYNYTSGSDTYNIDLSRFKLIEDSSFMNNSESIAIAMMKSFLSFPYILLWLFVLIFVFPINQNNIKNVANKHCYVILFFIVLIGFLLRLNNFNIHSLWGDELYSVGVVAYPKSSFMSVFDDPGNPPFYNFLLKIWLYVFGYSVEASRSLSVIIGSLFPITIFIFIKNHATSNLTTNKYIALLASLFVAVSQVAIGAAHEVRGYVLELTLIPLICNYLFNLYKKITIKDSILYVIFSVFLCNTHYYGSIFIFSSFIVSIFILKKMKPILVLFGLDCIIALSLLPYFYVTAFNKALMDTSFNSWITLPSVTDIFILPVQMFGGGVALFLLLLFSLFGLRVKNKMLIFCLLVCSLVIILACGISFIRPIYVTKYIIFAIYSLITVVICYSIIKFPINGNRFVFLVVCISLFSVALFDRNVSPIGRGDSSRAKFEFIAQDSKNYTNAYIFDLNTIMAKKERQYEIYDIHPNAKFIDASYEIKSGVFYLDSYYTESSHMLDMLKSKGATIYKIPFGRNSNNKLMEKMDHIHKVILN